MQHFLLFAGLLAALTILPGRLPSPSAATTPDIILGDFEGFDYGDWVTEGKSLSPGPEEPFKRMEEPSGAEAAK